jgi:hypothetical protein
MKPRRISQGLAAFVLVTLAIAGCSKPAQQIVGPSRLSSQAIAAPEAPPGPPPIDDGKYPRIRVWTDDGWRGFQKNGGVSLAPDRIFHLEIPELQAVTFHWSTQPAGASLGTRWALDKGDITDETPRSGPDDVTHWSTWSTTETSATVGPFVTGPDTSSSHVFSVEARDNQGFLSLFTVRIQVSPAAQAALPVRRR